MTSSRSFFVTAANQRRAKSSPTGRRRPGLRLESLESRRVLATLVSGQVAEDLNGNGAIDVDEPGQAMVLVYVDSNGNGEYDSSGTSVEPDNFDNSVEITAEGMTLSVVDESNATIADTGPIVANADPRGLASTGVNVFGYRSVGGDVSFFNHFFRMRVDFENPASSVQIDFTGESALLGDLGTLQAFDSDGNLVDQYDTARLIAGQTDTMSVSRTEGDIAYVLAYTNTTAEGSSGGLTGRLDALLVDGNGTEPSTLTDANGDYVLDVGGGGSHVIREVVPDGFTQTLPGGDGAQSVTVPDGSEISNVDFANETTPENGWQNPDNRFDVDDDGFVFPIDALLVINELNNPLYRDPVSGELPPPPNPVPFYFDVDGDGFASPTDAIFIINFLNSNGANAAVAAEGESPLPGRVNARASDAALESSDVAAAIDGASRFEIPRADAASAMATVLPLSEVKRQMMKRRLDTGHVESLFAGDE